MPVEYVTVSFEILKDHVPRFVDALCAHGNYNAAIEEEQREAEEAGLSYTPPTRQQFAKAQMRCWVSELERNYRRQKAEEDARNALAQTEDIDVQEETHVHE